MQGNNKMEENNKVIYNNKNQHKLPSSSIRRLQYLYNQQQKTYEAFDLQNFYSNKKINIQSLKDRIQKFKSSKNNLKINNSIKKDLRYNRNQQQVQTKRNNISVDQNNRKGNSFIDKLDHINVKRPDIRNIRTNSNARIMLNQGFNTNLKRQKLIKSNFQTHHHHSIQNPQTPCTTSHGKREKTQQQQSNQQSTYNFKIQPISCGLNSFKSHKDSGKNSRFSHPRSTSNQKTYEGSQSSSTIYQRKIQIKTQQQLERLEALVQQLWRLYQVMTKIMMGLTEYPYKDQTYISTYINEVCSTRYEQIKTILKSLQNKRLNRTIIVSKLLQNVSIVHLALQICKNKPIKQAHLVNFIGYCTSNIIFLIRILLLTHDIKRNKLISQFPSLNQPITSQKTQSSKQLGFKLSPITQSILLTLQKFQLQSYKQQLTSLLDVILRIQHNNEILSILQTRLCIKTSKDIQKTLTEFLKTVHYDTKDLCSYAHYIFQFLAYYIARQNLYGHLKSVQIAPQPYLNLKFTNTIIIQPLQVLFVQKNSNIFIRAFAQQFIDKISNYANVVFWTDLMPQQIDPIINLLIKKSHIYQLYKYHCIQNNGSFIKQLERIGGKLQNMIIIDRSSVNFAYNRSNGIQFGWKGQKKDTKLSSLLNLLQPMLSQNTPLRKVLATLRPQLTILSKKKKTFSTFNNLHRRKFEKIVEGQMNKTNSFLNNNNNKKSSIFEVEDDNLQLPMMVSRQGQHTNRSKMDQ